MKIIIKKYYSTDKRHLVEVRQRSDDLWEVEGFRLTTERVPGEGTYSFMEPFLGLALTDTLSNAEKLALETLTALSGVSRERLTYQVTEIEEEILVREVKQLEPGQTNQVSIPEARDPRFKDMKSWGIDTDYKPERNPSLEDNDLVPRARKVLEKITKGGKSIYSVEVCEMLFLIGRSLEKKGRSIDACRYWYNVSEITNNPWLAGWGTVSIELFREAQRREGISGSQFEIISTPIDLLREFIEGLGRD